MRPGGAGTQSESVNKEDVMFKTILWATDGSAAADRALPYAKELAEEGGKKIIAVHCRELMAGRSSGYPVLADDDELVEKIDAQVAELRAVGLDASAKVITGAGTAAAHVIAEAARDERADVIVAGTRGHTALGGLLLGSVTQRLLHIAPCPVLVVPTGKHAEAPDAELETTAASR
jgi:nucleotide-binding universal stress UspA family protein